jgi:hypothetical protein
MPVHYDGDGINGRSYPGPPISEFNTVDHDLLHASIMELEASRKLGRVQLFIRNSKHEPLSSIVESSRSLLRHVEEWAKMLRLQLHNDVSWAGMAVILK